MSNSARSDCRRKVRSSGSLMVARQVFSVVHAGLPVRTGQHNRNRMTLRHVSRATVKKGPGSAARRRPAHSFSKQRDRPARIKNRARQQNSVDSRPSAASGKQHLQPSDQVGIAVPLHAVSPEPTRRQSWICSRDPQGTFPGWVQYQQTSESCPQRSMMPTAFSRQAHQGATVNRRCVITLARRFFSSAPPGCRPDAPLVMIPAKAPLPSGDDHHTKRFWLLICASALRHRGQSACSQGKRIACVQGLQTRLSRAPKFFRRVEFTEMFGGGKSGFPSAQSPRLPHCQRHRGRGRRDNAACRQASWQLGQFKSPRRNARTGCLFARLVITDSGMESDANGPIRLAQFSASPEFEIASTTSSRWINAQYRRGSPRG